MGDGIYVVVNHEGNVILVKYYPPECEMEARGFADGWLCGAEEFCGSGEVEVVDTTCLTPGVRQTFLEKVASKAESSEDGECSCDDCDGRCCGDYDCEADE